MTAVKSNEPCVPVKVKLIVTQSNISLETTAAMTQNAITNIKSNIIVERIDIINLFFL